MAEQRITNSLTGEAEKQILRSLCRRMPQSITPDHLTVVGLAGGVVTFAGYLLTNWNRAFVLVACFGLVMNWFGDSLDGSLARYRKIERPKFGFYVDHLVDSAAMAFVACGIGVTPDAGMASALSVLAAYYLITILSLLESNVTGVFRISYNGVGPTEIRIVIIVLSLIALAVRTPWFDISGQAISIYDVIMFGLAATLVTVSATHGVATARAIAAVDPPRRSSEARGRETG